jgi:hypothetical protein
VSDLWILLYITVRVGVLYAVPVFVIALCALLMLSGWRPSVVILLLLELGLALLIIIRATTQPSSTGLEALGLFPMAFGIFAGNLLSFPVERWIRNRRTGKGHNVSKPR